jgi:hypothetical protein
MSAFGGVLKPKAASANQALGISTAHVESTVNQFAIAGLIRPTTPPRISFPWFAASSLELAHSNNIQIDEQIIQASEKIHSI